MTAPKALSPDQFALLVRLEHDALGIDITYDRAVVLRLCVEAVAAANAGVGTHRGRTARSAAHLFLSTTCPEMKEDVLRELSVACERVAWLGAEASEAH